MLERKMLHGNAETLVLALLAEDEQYGYRLRKELATRSNHYFQFAFGRLYPLLSALEQRGLVRAHWEKPGKLRQRKHYEITAKGLAELRDRKLRWRQFRAAMDRVLGG
ncbi:MAG TPA: PadR family transcriptional regulator [Verrucomicrobiae bacterium]|nr:PadR family transcriptional regulator [Verrucomicrobiae bacterium]